ncbi:hypothetical protein [Streptomyces bobili]|nr:hypothetical protein [Streptomyces bobili]
MTAVEWLLWIATAWAVFLAYCAIDAPTLCARAAHRLADRLHHGGTR